MALPQPASRVARAPASLTQGFAMKLTTEIGARTSLIRRIAPLRQCWPLILIFGAALLVRHFVLANTDVSWDITLCEKILDGQRLYIDLIEVNPPATIFLYMPAVVLARILGFPPEIAVSGFVFLIAFVSLGIASHVGRRYRLFDGLPGRTVTVLVLAILLVLPGYTFGEREHIALIVVLPWLAALAVRIHGLRPLPWHWLVAGLCAGITICIKPHFALAIGFAVLAAGLQSRSWRVLFAPENWIAAGVVAGYGLCVIVFYRPFITGVMPFAADVYLPARMSVFESLSATGMLLWVGAFLTAWALTRDAGRNALFAILLAASAGFAVGFVIQGKGWPYQSYPMLALAAAAAGLAAISAGVRAKQMNVRDGVRRAGVTVILGFIAVVCFAWFNLSFDTGAVAAIVKRVAPPHPAITVVSDDLAVGFPLVRNVEGRWISRYCSLWVIGNAAALDFIGGIDQPTRQRLSDYAQAQRQALVGDIRDGKPDVILVDDQPDRVLVDKHRISWREWMNADHDLSALIGTNYRQVGSADHIAVFKRNGS